MIASHDGSRESLGSDNHSGIHPACLQAIIDANVGHAHAYGMDPWTERAEAAFRREFGAESQTFFVFNGTAANVLALSALVEPHHAVICAEDAHVWNDECGAPERWLGCKLIPIPSPNGKINPDAIEAALVRGGDQHRSQPRAVTITQPTELGTLYSREELGAIARAAKARGLRVHVDGARLALAAAGLGGALADACAGADVISFGGSKIGLAYGEAIAFRDPDLAREFRFRRKQGMQLASKLRFVAAQLEALLAGEIWRTNALRQMELARRLANGLRAIGVEPSRPVESNAVFARFPKPWIKPLREVAFFYVWNEADFECRLMTSFDTSAELIDAFVARATALAREAPC